MGHNSDPSFVSKTYVGIVRGDMTDSVLISLVFKHLIIPNLYLILHILKFHLISFVIVKKNL